MKALKAKPGFPGEKELSQYHNTKIPPELTACHRNCQYATLTCSWTHSLTQSQPQLLLPILCLYPTGSARQRTLNNSWVKPSQIQTYPSPSASTYFSYTDITEGLRKEEGNRTSFYFHRMHKAWAKAQQLSYHSFSEWNCLPSGGLLATQQAPRNLHSTASHLPGRDKSHAGLQLFVYCRLWSAPISQITLQHWSWSAQDTNV